MAKILFDKEISGKIGYLRKQFRNLNFSELYFKIIEGEWQIVNGEITFISKQLTVHEISFIDKLSYLLSEYLDNTIFHYIENKRLYFYCKKQKNHNLFLIYLIKAL